MTVRVSDPAAPRPLTTVQSFLRMKRHDPTRIGYRQYCLDPDLRGAGVAYDTRARALLRLHGARQERTQQDDDELRCARTGLGHLGSLWLLDRLRRRHRRRPAR